MAETFHLKPHVLAQLRAAPPPAPDDAAHHVAAWRAAFPGAEPAVAAGAALLFPATPPETFARWLAIRSPISPEAEEAETILQDEPGRHALFPLRDPEMYEFRKTLEKTHWIAQEVVLDDDKGDLKKVAAGDRRLLERILGFFGIADELVMEGIDGVVSGLLRTKEGKAYLCCQSDQECVHSEAYSLQIQEIVPGERRDAVFNAATANPAVARMTDWVRWWTLAEHPAADVFAAMAFLEGVLFSGFFASIQHYKVRNLFPGVTAMNEFIARDEGRHAAFWCFLLTKRLQARPAAGVVAAIAGESVALSAAFFADAIPEAVIGLNASLVDQYVRYVADAVLVQAGYDPAYGAENPFGFMDMLALNEVAKSNFFEHRPTQYQNLGAGGLEFAIDESGF